LPLQSSLTLSSIFWCSLTLPGATLLFLLEIFLWSWGICLLFFFA
jgi:hypothetical protein